MVPLAAWPMLNPRYAVPLKVADAATDPLNLSTQAAPQASNVVGMTVLAASPPANAYPCQQPPPVTGAFTKPSAPTVQAASHATAGAPAAPAEPVPAVPVPAVPVPATPVPATPVPATPVPAVPPAAAPAAPPGPAPPLPAVPAEPLVPPL